MDENLKKYEQFIENMVADPNYVASVDENTAIYNIENDVKYADLHNEIIGCQSYEEILTVVKKYVKEDDFNSENLNIETSMSDEEREQLEAIINEKRQERGIKEELSEIEPKVQRFIKDGYTAEQIEKELNDGSLEGMDRATFYIECVNAYSNSKVDKKEKDNVMAKGLSYSNADLSNHGYVNLLFMAIVLTVIAFIILFKLF